MARPPKSPADPWKAPTWLDTAGKREWKRVVDLIGERGGLDELRREALERYAAAWSLFSASTAALPGCTAAEAEPLGNALSRACRMLRTAAADLGIPVPSVDPAPRSGGGSIERRPAADWFTVPRAKAISPKPRAKAKGTAPPAAGGSGTGPTTPTTH